jgi:dsRNA-specific ribonuclease
MREPLSLSTKFLHSYNPKAIKSASLDPVSRSWKIGKVIRAKRGEGTEQNGKTRSFIIRTLQQIMLGSSDHKEGDERDMRIHRRFEISG